MSFLLSVVLLNLFLTNCLSQDTSICESKETCGECIQELGCVWCSSPKILQQLHCLHESLSSSKWCRPQDLTSPTSNLRISQNEPLTSDETRPIQLQPQMFKLNLRRGEEVKIPFQYAQARNYPVDLYYIMDLSASMLTHKNKLGKLGEKLAEAMVKITNNFRLGFGSFVDKVELPFVSTEPRKLVTPCVLRNSGEEVTCVAPYSFINHMSLSKDYQKFAAEVNKAQVSGNIDAPEGGLDALMQAIVCKDTIQWRAQARHLIVFSTDADFHLAGDGKLAGIVEPNDAKCHMINNSYTDYLIYDYPSISQINHIAKLNNINIIFAIVDKHRVVDTYKHLSTNIENSNMGKLEGNSANVINLVLDNYNKIVDSVTITTNATDDIKVKLTSSCNSPKENGCTNIHVGEIVNFTATFQALECNSTGPNKRIISIKPEGIDESILVELNIICSCDCASPSNPSFKPNAPDCSNQGNLACGICNCLPGRFGRNCQCNTTTSQTENTTLCQKSEKDEVCSGLGVCKCGKCECLSRSNPDEKIYGKYCECNNYSCKKDAGVLCSGRGSCDCGTCKCQAGWTGDSCQCPDSDAVCMAPSGNNDIVCSGNGRCICGRCECSIQDNKKRYSGRYCEECSTCPAQRCEELRHCVECQSHGEGILSEEECKANCTEFITEKVDKLEEPDSDAVKLCRIPDKKDCSIIFTYTYDKNNELIVKAQKKKICPEPPNILAWIIGVIGSIVLAGLLALIIWKICTNIHDRREYAKFETERQNPKWTRNDNPLYRNAITNFSNPAYNMNRRSRLPSFKK